MTYTEHYSMKKPDGSDYVLVEDLNENFDTIDEALNEAVSGGGAAAEMISEYDESTGVATALHVSGDYFRMNGELYRATAAIPVGGAITVGTNCVKVTVGEELAQTNYDVHDHITDADIHITDDERTAWNAKQAALTFDTTPTAGSTNPVTSGGIKTALDGKKNTQSAVSDPTASGTSITFIDGITQNAQGVITPTKKTVQSATQSQAGVMSAEDKKKLDGVEDGAEANVQSDWEQTDTEADDYIRNKPTIDDTLSATSTNAIQNKAVAAAIEAVSSGGVIIEDTDSGKKYLVSQKVVKGFLVETFTEVA